MNNCLFEPSQLDRIEQKLDQLLAKKKHKPRASKPEAYSEQFEVLWREYPSTYGANKRNAYAAYCKRLEEGVAWIELKVAIEQYAAHIQATGRYVMLPATFFGPSRHWEDDWSIPTKSTLPSNDEELQAWASKNGHRQAHPGESYKAYRAYLEAES